MNSYKQQPLKSKTFLLKRLLSFPLFSNEKLIKPNGLPLIIIVGLPRSGSTFLSQKIINECSIDYIDNISCIFCFQIRLFFKILKKFRLAHKVSYRSSYGNTFRNGLLEPSECGDFFYRFFPYGVHQVEPKTLPKQDIIRFENELLSLLSISNRPIILKNLANSLRLKLFTNLRRINLKIIHITREKKDIIKSMKVARKKMNISKNDVWSIRTTGFLFMETNSEEENLKHQISKIENVLKQDLKLFKPENIREIAYSEIESMQFEQIKEWIYA